ncbi:MAG: hypothetical protein ACLFQV_13440 [Vulcanimicrobiota bacterium]
MFPEELKSQVESIREEVKQFIMHEQTYYGVTTSGFTFFIFKAKNISFSEEGEAFYNYMWVKCREGYFVLRQRFLKGKFRAWYLEAKIIPENDFNHYFFEMQDYFEQNPEVLEQICGPPHICKKCGEACCCQTESIYLENRRKR